MLYRVSVALDGLNKPVCVSNLGNRCRGHGTILNNCGIEYKKFTTCGKQNNSNVSEKWPKMPATAKVIPAKYVYESPTNTALGYQFCSNKLTVAAKKGAINNNENTCGPTTTFDVGSVKRLQTFRTIIPPAMTNDWPHSNPFKPAWMLIAFDKKTASNQINAI